MWRRGAGRQTVSAAAAASALHWMLTLLLLGAAAADAATTITAARRHHTRSASSSQAQRCAGHEAAVPHGVDVGVGVGAYSGARAGAEVLVPLQTDAEGVPLAGSSTPTFYHDHSMLDADVLGRGQTRTLRRRRRFRRAAVLNDSTPWMPDAVQDRPVLYYQLPLSDGAILVELWPSRSFVSPLLRLERWGWESTTDRQRRRRRSSSTAAPAPNPTACHYRGVVRGQPNSNVALSACGTGLMAMVRTEGGSFWLEPAATATPTGEHVVFRGAGAGAPSSSSSSSSSRRRDRDRDRDRDRRRKYKRRHAVDCGTKRATRPRRREASMLQWETEERGGSAKLRVQRRGRRSVSVERHVEVLLVADPSMTTFHQERDMETYLLAIMNMVSAMYHEPSIGNLINIVVVRIVALEEGQAEFNMTVNADKSLSSFCRWATEINPPDEDDPQHHDVAVLITRMDMCARGDSPCATLGVAHVGGMCNTDKSCSVNEDTGLVLAHTIAHELGHNFGMYHDTESSGCPRRDGDVLHVMTPAFEPDALHLQWSGCSRNSITKFLEQGSGECLKDVPTTMEYRYPDGLSGSMYDADHQCRLQFGDASAEVCSDQEEICQRLWCVVENVCSTLLRPAAEGTQCGHHKWCHKQQCTLMADPAEPVDGGWSEWGPWSPCSRTCGAGVSICERRCDHPAASAGGRYCLGERMRYSICNTQPCGSGEPSFRAVQCTAFNDEPYQGNNYTWLPYFENSEPCGLYCSDDADTIIVPRGTGAKDGTPCNVGKRDMCIGGVCRRVGCDWIVNSDAEEDRCGICRGNGSQCQTVKNVFNKTNGFGYTEVVAIPAGARNILVEEAGPSGNYIGIGNLKGNEFYLNGDRRITLGGEYDVGGAVALYERRGDRDRVRIPGPITHSIMVYLIFRGADRNPGLRYEYTIPLGGSVPPEAAWRYADWTACSATCGGGVKEARAVCMAAPPNSTAPGLLLPDQECNHLGPPPDKLITACSGNACPATWWSGPWQLCPATCGRDVGRQRSVLCVLRGHNHNIALPDSDCDAASRPPEQQRCPDLPPCPDADADADADADTHADSHEDAPDGISENADARQGNRLSDGELFPVTLSQPSAAGKPAAVLDLTGLDPDERDFLTANYVNYSLFDDDWLGATEAPAPSWRRKTTAGTATAGRKSKGEAERKPRRRRGRRRGWGPGRRDGLRPPPDHSPRVMPTYKTLIVD